MSHCPQCGELIPEEARACPFCGVLFAVRVETPKAPVVAPAGVLKANRTIVGMPAAATPRAEPRAPKPVAPNTGRTLFGVATVVLGTPATKPVAPPTGTAPKPPAKTLAGVAHPGIAPLAPGVEPEPDVPPARRPASPAPVLKAHELGATAGVGAVGDLRARPARKDAPLERGRRHVEVVVPKKLPRAPTGEEPISRRALAVVIAAGGLALAAVLVALFWPSPPPLTARARTDSAGREGVALTCKSCPDGTRVAVGDASAITTAGQAFLVPPTALSVGENQLRVAIDRPADGRDETVGVTVNVAYRIRPDLAALQAERPAFQIIAEAATGTTVSIDGRKLALAGGRGVESIDVTEVCTGLANDVKTLSRQIPYVVTPSSGPDEHSTVNVSVGVVPLHLDAPVAIMPAGPNAVPPPHVIIEGPSFVLAGWTMKGAEVIAAGKAITVHPDGSFAQVMNVSSAGATQIEVRARMPGMAPRLTQVKVRRVDSMEKAARELMAAESPIGYPELAASISAAIGKAVSFQGEVSESRKQGHQTVMLLDVAASSGCPRGGACTVRLVQGADNPAKRGDTLRVFGHVARAFSVPGHPDIPEVEVDFTLKEHK